MGALFREIEVFYAHIIMPIYSRMQLAFPGKQVLHQMLGIAMSHHLLPVIKQLYLHC